HRCEATIGVDDALADDLDRVGARARDRSAYAVAATAQERAALLSTGSAQRSARLVLAGESAWLAGQTDRAKQLLDAASESASGPVEKAVVEGLRGSIEADTGSLEAARDLLGSAARRLRDADPDAAVRLLADAVMTSFWMGDVETAIEAVELFDELATRTDDRQSRGLAQLGAGIALVLAGQPGIDRIREAIDELAAVTVSFADLGRPGWPVVGVLFLRESVTGRALLRRAVDEIRSRAGIASLPSLLFHTARDAATTDRWPTAASHYEESIALARESGQNTHLAMSLAGQAWLAARMGEEEDCRRQVAEALDLAARHQIHMARVWSTYALGDLELGLGRPGPAVAHFEELVRLLDALRVYDVDLWPGPELAESLHRAGRESEAVAVARRYHENATAKGQPWAMARAERGVAGTLDGEAADERFRAALGLHRLTPDVYEDARTRLMHGSMLRRRRLRVQARPLLRSALETFEAIGAAPWAETAARELAATGETPSRRGASPQALLTPQELQITRMLVAGRTTRETAAALFLSPKTVEYHLRKVYTKLDVHSRAELATALGDDVRDG
ncbi:MAG TPA: LuxR C-terminal-related transcriptional regulator, partial [Nocardioides sp.]|nr:LuxR C-terminal-related transcriptional regulator [Nocardioides sp.]